MEAENESSFKPCSEKIFNISCNWKITNGKSFHDAITIAPSEKAENRTGLDDIVSLDTCIALQSEGEVEPCQIEIKTTTNQAITRIAIVSETAVLEFFKQCGEYAKTVFADFIDNFDGNSPVYMAETTIEPPSTETSIKFTRRKTCGRTMWIYGIKLSLTEIEKKPDDDAFNYYIIKNLLSNCNGKSGSKASFASTMFEALAINSKETLSTKYAQEFLDHEKLAKVAKSSEHNDVTKNNINCTTEKSELDNVKLFIDVKLHDMETRLLEKLNQIEQNTNKKLESILTKLEHLTNKEATISE